MTKAWARRLPLMALAIVFAAATAPARAAAAWPPEVLAANTALANATSYRILSVDGTDVTTVEVQRPDRERIATHGQVLVRVGNGVWVRTPPGPWQPMAQAEPQRIAALGDITLPANAFVVPEYAASDGVSAAHLYHIVYPGGYPEIRWYVRISDGRVHKIERAAKIGTTSVTIDHYGSVPPINVPPNERH